MFKGLVQMQLKFTIDNHSFDWGNGLKHVALLTGRDTRDFIVDLTEKIQHPLYGHYTDSGSRADRVGKLVSLLEQRAQSDETHWSQHDDMQVLLIPNLDWVNAKPKQAEQLKYLLEHGLEHGIVVVIGRSWHPRRFRKSVLKPIADEELIFYSKCGEIILQ